MARIADLMEHTLGRGYTLPQLAALLGEDIPEETAVVRVPIIELKVAAVYERLGHRLLFVRTEPYPVQRAPVLQAEDSDAG